MLLNETTGRLRCDQCGGELDGPTAIDDGDAFCTRCQGRRQGFDEAADLAAREQLELAVWQAMQTLASAEIRSEVEQLLESGRPRYVEVR